MAHAPCHIRPQARPAAHLTFDARDRGFSQLLRSLRTCRVERDEEPTRTLACSCWRQAMANEEIEVQVEKVEDAAQTWRQMLEDVRARTNEAKGSVVDQLLKFAETIREEAR